MNILTFDIEEWFHVLDNNHTKTEKDWSNFESRIHQNMNTIFELLDNSKQKATFFCVGWIAEKYPEVIKEIISRGFEVGSHTHLHQLVYDQSPKQFEEDLKRSIQTLEDASGQKVRSFRAPGFSITSETPWAFETLLKNGIEIDCSVFPASRAHGGFNSFGHAEPAYIELNGMRLKELPINTHEIGGKKLVFSGGGYFRLFPYGAIKSFTQKSDYVMTYFHPRDFDFDQPMLPGLSLTRKFKSYYGLKQAKPKLQRWLNDFNFMDIASAEKKINWDKVKVVNL
ncbi:polysaccharide deacetylase family protein [Zhouia amylolytica]|uniref:Polysaccharide deacetylase n=1 Tax=Zhouia amylolytica AD3 TaxID=1286632 RepID=W2UR57_9FLAO|nr:polysaccharide deacetylase family protein [Zhouia amylolytica]ETN95787.1 polysaccharide deacetylase [Zhouia amylolytica AD3]